MARTAGVDRFDAEVLARNGAMLRVFEGSGLPMETQPEQDGVVRLSLSLLSASPGAASR